MMEEIFTTLDRVTASGIWIASPRHALQSAYLIAWWRSVFRRTRKSGRSFSHTLGPHLYLRRKFQLFSIAGAAGVRDVRFDRRGGRRNGTLPPTICLMQADDSLLSCDPLALVYEFADAKFNAGSYRRKVKSRLSALFLTAGIRQLADVQPARVFPFLAEETRKGRMTKSTANAYRIALWNFVRWLVYDRKQYALARMLARLDAQGVKQTTLIRGGRKGGGK